MRTLKYDMIPRKRSGIMTFSSSIIVECVDSPLESSLGQSSTVKPWDHIWLGLSSMLGSLLPKCRAWLNINIMFSPDSGSSYARAALIIGMSWRVFKDGVNPENSATFPRYSINRLCYLVSMCQHDCPVLPYSLSGVKVCRLMRIAQKQNGHSVLLW